MTWSQIPATAPSPKREVKLPFDVGVLWCMDVFAVETQGWSQGTGGMINPLIGGSSLGPRRFSQKKSKKWVAILQIEGLANISDNSESLTGSQQSSHRSGSTVNFNPALFTEDGVMMPVCFF